MDDFQDENDFNPNVNYEDAEFLEHAKKTVKAAQYLQQQQARQYNDKVLNDSWVAALDAEGIDAATYNQLASQDPELVQEAIRDNLRGFVQRVKRGRSPDGRFTKQQPQHGRNVQQRREQRPAPKIDDLREKAKTGSLSSAEEMEVLDSVLGKLF